MIKEIKFSNDSNAKSEFYNGNYESLYLFKMAIIPKNKSLYNDSIKILQDLNLSSYSKCIGENLGIEIYNLKMINNSNEIRVSLWLINPEKRFETLKENYIKGSHANFEIKEGSDLSIFSSKESLLENIVKEIKFQPWLE